MDTGPFGRGKNQQQQSVPPARHGLQFERQPVYEFEHDRHAASRFAFKRKRGGMGCADGIHFRDTHLGAERRPMQWERCDLAGTVFRDCDLSGVQLDGCSVKGMKIDGVAVEDLLAAYERCKSGEKND
ncbi:hypothetical protein D1872_244560 [compost metagenome]